MRARIRPELAGREPDCQRYQDRGGQIEAADTRGGAGVIVGFLKVEAIPYLTRSDRDFHCSLTPNRIPTYEYWYSSFAFEKTMADG
jgi:hypothetical protein